VHGEQAAVQNEEHVFGLAISGADAAPLGLASNMRRGLRFYGDSVKDMDTTDSPALDERAESANNSFHFREFRHVRRMRSRSGL
jgi:hypothetical protein